MRKGYLVLLSALLGGAMSSAAQADITNGGFEQWTGASPEGWSSDTGIAVTATTDAHTGNYAAAITVNTGTQSSTDFRQSISVQAGTTYDFSVWIKHTEGGVRARLYADGYQNYSDPAVLNQWQQLSYSYTATSSGSIEVGLRFYDVSGFDGSETVLVDDYEPSSGSTSPPATDCTDTTLNLTTDNYGAETSWEITLAGTGVAMGSDYDNNQSVVETVCLEDGDYTFSIYDSYGDGICCGYGNGYYELVVDSIVVATGGEFNSEESTTFSVPAGSGTGGGVTLTGYYASANGLAGYALKTELYNIINNHSAQSYSALWNFYDQSERDLYYENDGSILDIYSENPSGNDPYNYGGTASQCGTYNSEADCYNREHSFPRSWFGGAVAPMNTDVHHIFASDGYVNSKRSSYPYGEVGSASYTSANGSKLGSPVSGLGYSGTVFEPIDVFKGDLARAYFYMATRYENVIGGWENNSSGADAVLNGSSDQVFEAWFLNLLLSWHNQDPVSQKELDRNEAAFSFQGNRNPYVDHPELVQLIWGQ